MQTISEIRQQFQDLAYNNVLCENGTIELRYVTFKANEATIFGTLDGDYAVREVQWYLSQSLNVNDIPGKVPKIWQDVASTKGEINSNYGYLVFGRQNNNQFNHAVNTLKFDKHSRQALMVYTRPTVHQDSTRDGMKDFICTNYTQLIIRNGKLDMLVNMRSNDAVYGYKNDRYWQTHVLRKAFLQLKQVYPDLVLGDLIWQVTSLHVYPRHFGLIKL